MARPSIDETAAAISGNRAAPDAHATRSALEWQILSTTGSNVLVTGPRDAVERSLAKLLPQLDPPVWSGELALLPPTGGVGTLVLRDVDALTAGQQHALLSWLYQTRATPTRVVSTTLVSLFERVVAGVFLELLYYRLNTLLLVVSDEDACEDRPSRCEASAATATRQIRV